MELNISDKNLDHTLIGGQAFNWIKVNNIYYGFFTEYILKLEVRDNKVILTSSHDINLDEVNNYFNTYINLDNIKKSINIDENINKAIKYIDTVRILKQDFETTLLSFILTSHKNIKAVRKLVNDLSKYYGKKILFDNLTFYTFPKSIDISNSSELKLRELGVGFRSRYLLEASLKLSDKSYLNVINALNEDSIREYLLTFNGVGEKIADCVLAFSLNIPTVTPIDVWSKRVLTNLYNVSSDLKYIDMREWYKSYFKENTLYAGQYLFEYLRQNYKSK